MSAPTSRYLTTSTSVSTPRLAASEHARRRDSSAIQTSESGSSAGVDNGSDLVTLKRGEIDVRRVETVEEHQAVRAGPHELGRHVRRRREIRRQLDGDGNADARPDFADDVQVPPLHVGAADREIDRDRVDVELDRRGARLLETGRVFDPACRGRAVEARDHRDVERLRRTPQRLEMSGHPAVVVGELGKIAARLRLAVRSLLRVQRVGRVLGADLLFVERRHDDRGRAGILEAPHAVERGGERRRTRHDRVGELQAEIA